MNVTQLVEEARRNLRRSLLLVLACGAIGSAHAAPPACALDPADLEKVFGVKFDKGKEEPAFGMGTSCKYHTVGGSLAKGTDFSVFLGIIPTGGQMQMFRTMLAGPAAKLVPVPGDPDKAVIVQIDPKVPPYVTPYPYVMYERGDLLVQLQVLGGVPTGDAKADAARIQQMNEKLLKLRRVP
jgi:hypothetical protein